MEITLTQRIVGAIVILSLAIIFIPALLESDRFDSGKGNVSPIPEVPREISTIVFQLNESTGKFEEATKLLKQEATDAMTAAENEQEIVSADTNASEIITENQAVESASVESGNNNNSVIAMDNSTEAHSWLVQIASFKDKEKAISIRDDLRQKQYVTRINQRKLSAGSIWRVRVGPFATKEKARAIMASIEKETGMAGLIIRRR